MLALGFLTGCNTFNGAVDGFERDVDRLVANVDHWSDGFLPADGPGPQRYEPTHFDIPDNPRPPANRPVRVRYPGR